MKIVDIDELRISVLRLQAITSLLYSFDTFPATHKFFNLSKDIYFDMLITCLSDELKHLSCISFID